MLRDDLHVWLCNFTGSWRFRCFSFELLGVRGRLHFQRTNDYNIDNIHVTLGKGKFIFLSTLLEDCSVTPLKTNMSPENQWLEDVLPTESSSLFRGHSLVFGGHSFCEKGKNLRRNYQPLHLGFEQFTIPFYCKATGPGHFASGEWPRKSASQVTTGWCWPLAPAFGKPYKTHTSRIIWPRSKTVQMPSIWWPS